MAFTAQEQLMIELVNQARLDPEGEPKRLGITNQNEIDALNLPGGTIAPLASNANLGQAADNHSNWMNANDTFSHTGENGSSAGERMADAGYVFRGSWTWGENIAFRGSTGSIDVTASTYLMHQGLFESDGHRANILNGNFRELGVGIKTGEYQGYNSVMATQNFAASGGRVFLTGVAYNDNDGDDFYSVGEGVGNIRFSVDGASDTTEAAGGYNVLYSGSGTKEVTISGGGVSARVDVKFNGGNVKLDLVDKDTLLTSADLTLLSGIDDARLLGLNNLDLTGHSGNNTLTGNAGQNEISGQEGKDVLKGLGGDDTLNGGSGDDRLIGGDGDDVIDGGSDTDTAVIKASSNSISVTEDGSWIVITSEDGTDRFRNVESFVFNDKTLSVNDLINTASNQQSSAPNAPINTLEEGTVKSSGVEWSGSQDAELVSGGGGDDTLKGGGGNDEISAGKGDDRIYGGNGKDTIKGNVGDDLIFADGGDDRVVGQRGRDTIEGGDGDDNLKGGGQSDELHGDAGDDFLKGGTDNDIVQGGAGKDKVAGNAGNDMLDGGSGRDNLKGGGEDDRLTGGTGNDVLKGGAGSDIFVFSSGHGKDRIIDFDARDDDEKIDLSDVSSITDMSDLRANHMSQSGADVVIETGGGNSITLKDVRLSDLDGADFIF